MPEFPVNGDEIPSCQLFPILEKNPLERNCFRPAERRAGLGEQLLMPVEVVLN